MKIENSETKPEVGSQEPEGRKVELVPPMEGEEENKAESEKRESGNEMEVRDEKPVEEPREEMRPEAVEKIEKGEGGLITRPRSVNLNVLSPMGKNLMSLTNVRDTMTGKFLTGQQLDDLQRSQGRI